MCIRPYEFSSNACDSAAAQSLMKLSVTSSRLCVLAYGTNSLDHSPRSRFTAISIILPLRHSQYHRKYSWGWKKRDPVELWLYIQLHVKSIPPKIIHRKRIKIPNGCVCQRPTRQGTRPLSFLMNVFQAGPLYLSFECVDNYRSSFIIFFYFNYTSGTVSLRQWLGTFTRIWYYPRLPVLNVGSRAETALKHVN